MFKAVKRATGGKKQKTNAILRFTVITMAIILVASKNSQHFSNRVRQTMHSADAFLHKRSILEKACAQKGTRVLPHLCQNFISTIVINIAFMDHFINSSSSSLIHCYNFALRRSNHAAKNAEFIGSAGHAREPDATG
jgi:hypothetical protein